MDWARTRGCFEEASKVIVEAKGKIVKDEEDKIRKIIEKFESKSNQINQQIKTLQTSLEKLDSDMRPRIKHQNECLAKAKSELDSVKMESLKFKLAEICTLTVEKSIQTENNDFECPICNEIPDEYYCCDKCANWVCQKCKNKIDKCPFCNQNLIELPLRRNKALERLININR